MNRLSTVSFLSYLRSLNVKLSTDGDRLRYDSPTGVVTPDLQNELTARKREILRFLKEACEATRPQAPTIGCIPRDGVLPLSFAQTRLWLLNQLEHGSLAYNLPYRFRLRGNLNLSVFEQSLSEIIRRHEVLRAYYRSDDGSPVQKIAPPEPFKISVFDLQSLSEPAQQKEAARLALVDATQRFDLGKAPMMRATLLRLAPEEQILLLNMYHIAFDGWSFGVFLHELSALYKAFLNGQVSPLPELPIQYVDFAAWQQQWLQGGVLQAQLDYWKGKLSGSLPVVELPTDRPRPAVQTYNGEMVSCILSKKLTNALRTLSQQEEVTLFVTLLAAFKVLLLRYTGQADILVGTPIANRNRAEIESLIGFFVNTLVMRTDLSGNPTFRELVQRVKDTAFDAYAHQDLPFEKLVEEVRPKRDISWSPIFQVLFSLLNTPMQSLELPGLEVSYLEFHSSGAKFDLSLYVIEKPEGLSCTFEYNTDLFNADRIQRMLRHLQVLLEGIVANPEQRLSELPLLTQSERRQLLVEWNATRQPYPQACVHELFEAQAQRTPDAAALVSTGAQLTYRQLNQRANQLAHYLRNKGVAAEQRVAVYMERSLDMVVGLLGILKAGAAYVPIDPAYPQERVSFMLQDAKPSVALTEARHVATLPEWVAKVVCLDRDWTEISKESQENPACNFTPDDLAYVIYTSGSTGKPKGVMGKHRGAVNRFQWMWQTYPFETDEVCCHKTSLSFVDSIWEIFGPLLQGVKTVIVPDDVVKDPPRFVDFLAAHRVTRIVLVPSLLRAILDACGGLHHRLPRLKYWVTSGEALSVELAQRFAAGMPDAVLLNLYGSSEVTADSTCYRLEKDETLNCVPIGRPIANTQVYILDTKLQPVPTGVAGKLYIGGDGLARGYWSRPEMTTERFIRNPFSEDPNARLYNTGDLARYLPDGAIEYLGRTDNQVKIRGFRIELGEIESVLAECADVKQAVVVAQDDHTGNKRLVAYVARAQTRKPKTNELQAQMKQKMPDYMIPSAFVFLESLPLLPNGKIDRQALPALEQPDRISDSEIVAPRNDVERQLLAIWEKVLGVRKIGIHDDFFELGGHSLLIPVILARIEEAFKKRMSPASIFQAPTVERLAALIRAHGAELVQVMPIQPLGSKPPFFCIHLAKGPLLRELALKLGDDQPFLGLGFDPSALDKLKAPYTLEDIAANLVQAIRERQADGPYFIGGFCLNGLVALETARQLRSQGQHVALLVLFEAVNPAHHDSFSQRSQLKIIAGRFSPRLLKNHVTRLYVRGTDGARTYVQSRMKDIKRDISNLVWSTGVELKLKLGAKRLRYLREILYVAARSYRPVPYSGRAAFFRCTQRRATTVSELEKGWSGILVGDFELHVLEGDHLGILVEPSLHLLAEKLQTALLEAEKGKEKGGKVANAVRGSTAEVCADLFCGLNV